MRCTKCGADKAPEDMHHRRPRIRVNGVKVPVGVVEPTKTCKVCASEANRRWNAENAEKKRAYQREYQQRNREASLAYLRQWQAENTEKRREFDADYHARNRERRNAQSREWQKANPERARALQQKTRRARRVGRDDLAVEYANIICREPCGVLRWRVFCHRSHRR